MKKNIIWAISGLFWLCGCGKPDKEIPISAQSLSPLQFTLNITPEILPFPSTKNIPPLDIPEPTPENPDNGDTNELFSCIDYIVYQVGEPDLLIKHKQFTPEDTDFGIIYDSLPAGDYHICFLAHSDKSISISGQTASFKKQSDTFHLFHTQAIQTGVSIEQDLDLTRIISKIEFVSTDAMPENLGKFTLEINGYQDQINLQTGLGTAQAPSYIQTYTPLSGEIGKTGITYAFYAFIPSSDNKLGVNLCAHSKEGNIMRSRSITNISPIQNRVIRYTGKLYTSPISDESFSIHIANEGKWDNPVENKLQD